MPPVSFTCSIASWIVSVPDECDSGVTQTVQSQLSPPSTGSGGHSRRQLVSLSGKVRMPSRA